MLKPIGMLILALGIIVAVCAAAKRPEAGATFPDTWTAYGLGWILAAGGVAVWRRGIRHEREHRGATHVSVTNPIDVLRQLRGPLEALKQDAAQLDVGSIETRLDQLTEDFILPFGDAHGRVIHELGVERAAELIISFSACERYLNRAWSAAGDGHLDEAVASVNAAVGAYHELPL